MLSFTRKTDYALVALACLSRQRDAGRDVAEALSARKIADQYGLPLPLLMNILKDLAHARIISSTRGVQGGYTLARAPEAVSLMEVIAAIEGPVKLVQCSDGCADGLPIAGQMCEIHEQCPVREPIRRLHDRINHLLETTSLADLLTEVSGHGSRVTSQKDKQLVTVSVS